MERKVGHPGQFLLQVTDLPPDVEKAKYPKHWEYLQMGVEQGICDRYLCKHRSPWYAQEKRPPSPFLCTYMGRQDTGRGRPFRFILNHSRATATNVYLMLYQTGSCQSAFREARIGERGVVGARSHF